MNRRERRALARQTVRRVPGMNGADLARARSQFAKSLTSLTTEAQAEGARAVLSKPFRGLRQRKSGLIAPE